MVVTVVKMAKIVKVIKMVWQSAFLFNYFNHCNRFNQSLPVKTDHGTQRIPQVAVLHHVYFHTADNDGTFDA